MIYQSLYGVIVPKKNEYIKKALKINPNKKHCDDVFNNCLLGSEMLPANSYYISGFGKRFFKAIGKGFKKMGKGIKKAAKWVGSKIKDGNLQANAEGISYQSPNVNVDTARGQYSAQYEGKNGGGGISFNTNPKEDEQGQAIIETPQKNNTLLIAGGVGLLALMLIAGKK